MRSVPSIALDPPRLSPERAARLAFWGRIAAVVGVIACAGAALADHRRFAFSYLVGFAFTVTLALGALVFVILQHLTRAGWSVAPRRQMEWVAGALPLLAVVFVPVALLAPHLYEWLGPEAAKDELLRQKAVFLNAPFFLVRAAVYFGAWALLSMFFTRASLKQDVTGDVGLTRRMQFWSAPSAVLFGLTITFAGFDWLMSLQPRWYSTIFGVYVFSGAFVGALALLALLTIGLQASGAVKAVSTVEHRHDIGKLLFGFTIFWAYIAFSQYFLIWYANIPEETIFFAHRWVGGWKAVSLLLVFGNFAVPFVLLLSRAGKRSNLVLGFTAALLLAMHYVDLYWLVMPVLDAATVQPSWIDLAALVGPLGVLALWVATRAAKGPLYPLRDPRLREAVGLENA